MIQLAVHRPEARHRIKEIASTIKHGCCQLFRAIDLAVPTAPHNIDDLQLFQPLSLLVLNIAQADKDSVVQAPGPEPRNRLCKRMSRLAESMPYEDASKGDR